MFGSRGHENVLHGGGAWCCLVSDADDSRGHNHADRVGVADCLAR